MSTAQNTGLPPRLQGEFRRRRGRKWRLKQAAMGRKLATLPLRMDYHPIRRPGWLDSVPRLDDRDSCPVFIVYAGLERLVAATLEDAKAIVARLPVHVAATARIQAMAATVHEGLKAPDVPSSTLVAVNVRQTIADTLRKRCRLAGISFERLVAALMLHWLERMTPQKTGASLIANLQAWERGRSHGFREWTLTAGAAPRKGGACDAA